MNEIEKKKLLDTIQRACKQRETKLRREAAAQGIDYDAYEELRKSQPRHDMCEKLNSLSAVHAIESYNLEQQLGSMRGKTQAQGDGGSAFEQAVNKAGIAYFSDDPVQPKWGERQQREWQQGNFRPRPGVENSTAHTNRNPSFTQEKPGVYSPTLNVRHEEAGGSLRGDDRNYWPSGESGSAGELEAEAYQQIRSILGGRRTVAY